MPLTSVILLSYIQALDGGKRIAVFKRIQPEVKMMDIPAVARIVPVSPSSLPPRFSRRGGRGRGLTASRLCPHAALPDACRQVTLSRAFWYLQVAIQDALSAGRNEENVYRVLVSGTGAPGFRVRRKRSVTERVRLGKSHKRLS